MNDARRGPSVARFVIDGVEYWISSHPSALGVAVELTPVEREVAELLLGGASYREIAARRGRSVRTIAKQVASVFKKLGVSSRSELAAVLVSQRVR